MKAIVYTSNTGSAKAYAEMLGEKTALPVLPFTEAVKTLDSGTDIIYIGWLMAGTVVNLAQAQKRYHVRAVLGVGMTASEEMAASVRRRNHLDDSIPLFLAQGAYDKTKLRGMYRIAMKFVGAAIDRKVSAKPDRTPEEERILVMLRQGGSGISEDYLAAVLAWYRGNGGEALS